MSYGEVQSAYSDNVTVHLELAILQKDVDANKPGKAPFKIPAIMADEYKGRKYVNNHNVNNKDKTGTPSVSTVMIDNEIELDIPKEYTRWYGNTTIPKDTKFIVAFVGGDINSIRIVGRYEISNISDEDFYLDTVSLEKKIDEKFDELKEELDTWIGAHEAEAADRTARIQSNASNIASLRSEIATIRSSISDIRSTLSSHSSTINSNYTTLDSAISALESRVAALEARI